MDIFWIAWLYVQLKNLTEPNPQRNKPACNASNQKKTYKTMPQKEIFNPRPNKRATQTNPQAQKQQKTQQKNGQKWIIERKHAILWEK